MKIAFVSDVMYPWVKGGAEKRIWEIGRRLSKKHDVHVYTMRWWENDKEYEGDEDIIEKEGMKLHGVCKPTELYSNGRRSIKEAIYFSRKLLGTDFSSDILDFNQFPYIPCLVGRLMGKGKREGEKMVVTWHEYWGNYWYEYLGRLGFVGIAVEKLASKVPNQIVAVSETTSKRLEEIGRDSTVIPNGVDHRKIREAYPSARLYDVLFVGRLIKEKNVNALIKAVEYTTLTLGIIGSGPEEEKLKELASNTEARVDFIGEVDYEDVIGHMKSSRIFALPSSREGFGITALEAMACGTPVLTVNEKDNAAKDLIKNKNGIITDLNPRSIREGLLTMLEDRGRTMEMGKRAAETAREYAWDDIADQTLQFYKSIL